MSEAEYLPLAVFDLDDTLAHTAHRAHILEQEFPSESEKWDTFFDACDKDSPNYHMLLLLHACIRSEMYRVEIWTGRSERVRSKTEAWLKRYMVDYPEESITLRMRAEGDIRRHDTEVKQDWLAIEGDLPAVAFDDRNSVVAWWREQGVLCCQVKDNDF